MRGRAAAILSALLAAGALTAAKPVPPPAGDGPDQARERWRGHGISLCVGELRAIPEFSPDDLESICGCAVDRYLQGQGNRPSPDIRLQGALESQMVACTARIRPERAADVARQRMAAAPQSPAPVAVAPPLAGKPTVEDEAPAEAEGGSEGESSGGGVWAWLSNLSWPAWLTGASVLWWVALGIFVFGLLILKLRRRDPRKDLSAPPSYMRRGVPPPPRRPDLPR